MGVEKYLTSSVSTRVPMDNRIKSSAVTLLDASGFAWLMKPFFGGRGMILTLHSVIPPDSISLCPGIAITTSQLEAILEFFREKKWDVIALRDVPDRLRSRNRGRYFVCITLDDGYADNLQLAAPLFRKYETPYSLFVITGVLDRTFLPFFSLIDDIVLSNSKIEFSHPVKGMLSFNCDSLESKRAAAATLRTIGFRDPKSMTKTLEDYCKSAGLSLDRLTDDLMLSWKQVKTIAKDKLATIGSHTVTHARLAAHSSEDAAQEMQVSRARLQSELGCSIEEIAYPFGSVPDCCSDRDFRIAREAGYLRGVTTQRWNLFPQHRNELLSLPRVGISLTHSANNRFVRVSAYGAWNVACRLIKGA